MDGGGMRRDSTGWWGWEWVVVVVGVVKVGRGERKIRDDIDFFESDMTLNEQ